MAIHLIGTSHIAKQSVREVKGKILKLEPDIVAVELDFQRYLALKNRQSRITIASIRQIGFLGYVFAKFGSWMQHKLGQETGLLPGEEMLTAVNAAREANAKVAFVDMPITQTLQKLSKEVPLTEKLRLVGYIIISPLVGEKIEFDISKVPEQKVIAKLTSVFRKKFPTLYKVLVSDRDEWIAHQLKHLQMAHPDANIIAVVGAGHLKGVKEALQRL